MTGGFETRRFPIRRPSILMPPPGLYPRIPPFPPGIYFGANSGQPQVPPAPPPPTEPHGMVYKQNSDSSGYRLMVSMPVGHREDGTYGVLTYGVRPDQEYRLSTYYVNNVTYYNVPGCSEAQR